MKAAIYIITSAGRVKIGYSKNPWSRYRQLCTGCPTPMALVMTLYCHDAPEFERHLHKVFAHKREQGEWFSISVNEVLKAISDRGLSQFRREEKPREEDNAKDDQDEWKCHWDIVSHGPIPESRLSASKDQLDIIESFYREATDEDLRGYFTALKDLVKGI
jgi:hypothetical protein